MRSWADKPSNRSISGFLVSSPSHDRAISTISGEWKWARCASGDSHFSMMRNRPGVVTDPHRSMFRQPGCWRERTTYFDKIEIKRSGSAASKPRVTIVSSTSSAIVDTVIPRRVGERGALDAACTILMTLIVRFERRGGNGGDLGRGVEKAESTAKGKG